MRQPTVLTGEARVLVAPVGAAEMEVDVEIGDVPPRSVESVVEEGARIIDGSIDADIEDVQARSVRGELE